MDDITITLATCCRNRADHVKTTLPKNIKTSNFPYVRFMLVNYNSQDDLDEWAREELIEHIESGRLLYIHEKTADRFKHAHARNVAVRCCQTEVFCNVDADNFTGWGFVEYLSDVYLEHRNKPVFTAYGGGTGRGSKCGSLFGRISFRVKQLVALGGYNEDLNQWGIEDYDLSMRGGQAGYKRVSYPEAFDINPLPHAQHLRIEGTDHSSTLASLRESEELHLAKFGAGMVPNAKGQWGKATVEVNWKRTVELPLSAGEVLP